MVRRQGLPSDETVLAVGVRLVGSAVVVVTGTAAAIDAELMSAGAPLAVAVARTVVLGRKPPTAN